ncbi:hypothetical protein PHLGIDRAFT_51208, partial [Phlebiopsis gigantea 11061_1 CR5-6]
RLASFFEDEVEDSGFGDISFKSAQYVQPFADTAWVVARFECETKIAKGRGVARLVPTRAG